MTTYHDLKKFLKIQRAELVLRANDAMKAVELTGNLLAAHAYHRDVERIVEIDTELNRLETLMNKHHPTEVREMHRKALRQNTIPFKVIKGGK